MLAVRVFVRKLMGLLPIDRDDDVAVPGGLAEAIAVLYRRGPDQKSIICSGVTPASGKRDDRRVMAERIVFERKLHARSGRRLRRAGRAVLARNIRGDARCPSARSSGGFMSLRICAMRSIEAPSMS